MKIQQTNGHIKRQEKGFSLIESLISLSIFLAIVLASLEFFGFSRSLYLKLKIQEETGLAAFSALERMKTDVLRAGLGLLDPIHLNLLEGITKADEALIILSEEKNLSPVTNLFEGQTRIQLESTEGIKKERDICIFDSSKGELKSISSVEKKSIVLSSPLSFFFLKEKTRLVLLEKISLFYDSEEQTIRRKVNSSPAQPLLEEAASFNFDYEKTTNIVRLRLALTSRKEKIYETSVYPKNTALANSR
jgi:prepilin-type N-terminal cleavage/methylation domain-containing protein